MFKLNKIIVAAGVAAALSPALVSAASVSYVTAFDMISGNGGTMSVTDTGGSPNSTTRVRNFSINGFDSSLGTLTSATFTLDSDYRYEGRVRADGLTAKVWTNGDAEFRGTVNLPSGAGSNLVRNDSDFVSCVGYSSLFNPFAECSDTESDSGAFNGSRTITDASALSQFVTNNLAFSLSARIEADLNTCWKIGIGHCDLRTRLREWDGNLRVTYNYDAPIVCPGDPSCPTVDTPEPSALLLLGLGILGLGVARRRKLA